MNKKELRNKLVAELEAIQGNEDLTSEDITLCNEKLTQIEKLDAELKASDEVRSAIANKVAELNKPAKKVSTLAVADETRDWQDSKEYRQWFYGEYIKNGKESREFRDIASREVRDLSLGTPSAGGYLLPKVASDIIWDRIENQSVIYKYATRVPIVAGGSSVPITSARVAEATFVGENTAPTADTQLAFAERLLTPRALSVSLNVSNLLLNNQSAIEQRLTREVGLAVMNGIEKYCIGASGDGSGKPYGLFYANANGIPSTRDVFTGNTITGFTRAGLNAALMKVDPAYMPDAVWIMHPDAYSMAMGLVDGENRPYYTNTQFGSQANPGFVGSIEGKPVLLSKYAPNTFTTGLYAGIVGNLREYFLGVSQDISVLRLGELEARKLQTVFFAYALVDGVPGYTEAFARVKLA